MLHSVACYFFNARSYSQELLWRLGSAIASPHLYCRGREISATVSARLILSETAIYFITVDLDLKNRFGDWGYVSPHFCEEAGYWLNHE